MLDFYIVMILMTMNGWRVRCEIWTRNTYEEEEFCYNALFDAGGGGALR